MLDQSNQYIADRRAWKEERQRLEAENARLRAVLDGVTILEQANLKAAVAQLVNNIGLRDENARLRDALKIIAAHNPERGTALETVVIFAAMTLANEQRAFESGIDAGKRLAECGELPY